MEQIVEPAMRIITSPTVRLGLELRYAALRLNYDGAPDRSGNPDTRCGYPSVGDLLLESSDRQRRPGLARATASSDTAQSAR
jgi:hypothetical protein